MKKLLILAYDFPPYVSVGGLRPYNWFMYLKEFDVEPIVITRQWANTNGNHLDYISPGVSPMVIEEKSERGTIYCTPYHPNLSNRLLLKYGDSRFRFIRKMISGYYEFAQFLFPVGPKAGLYDFARDYLKKNEVDAIIATGDPFVLFSYASKLSKEFGIPWIADYRDTWVQDKSRSGNRLTKTWNSYFERRFLRNTEKISTVSSFIIKQLQKNLPNKNYEIVPNGFNPDVMYSASDIKQQDDVFTISFAGTIYNWHPIHSFLKICNNLLEQKKIERMHLQFYGINHPSEIQQAIQNKFPALLEHVTIFPKIDNEELVKKLAESNAFLLFNDYSILGTKIFTYIGIKRKIIFCYSDDNDAVELKRKFYNLPEFESESKQLQADLINETESGIIVENADHLKVVLSDLWNEFQSTGKIACNSIGVEKYSRKIQVEKLAEIVKQITA
jgi:glycosyltransferase involved in cell wall biosynthesis